MYVIYTWYYSLTLPPSLFLSLSLSLSLCHLNCFIADTTSAGKSDAFAAFTS